ncbi:MAG: multicopper oxidase domain-containing protein, partial [Planctomycetes bacterium]|nr:multicopper oxidase domain-containing protein [Planctomycetota bacterium]
YAPPGNYSPNRLSYDLLASAEPSPPLPIAPQRFYSLDMGFNPISYTFFLGGQAFPNANTVDVTHGEDVRITMQNFTGQYHPMHLHGHFFRLHTAAGGTQNPPLRDTVLVPPASMAGIPQVSFDFVADSPGQWVFHCHTIYHAESGMNRVVTYVGGDQDQDGLDDSIDYEPLDAHPVLTADDMGFGFVPGGAVSLDCQWRQGTPTWFYYGLDLGQPLSLGAIGDLQIFSSYLLALTHAGIHDVASLVLPIPNVPNLTGFRAVFQALVYDAALNPSFRLSTPTVVRVN